MPLMLFLRFSGMVSELRVYLRPLYQTSIYEYLEFGGKTTEIKSQELITWKWRLKNTD